jgi:hypothetical protein
MSPKLLGENSLLAGASDQWLPLSSSDQTGRAMALLRASCTTDTVVRR